MERPIKRKILTAAAANRQTFILFLQSHTGKACCKQQTMTIHFFYYLVCSNEKNMLWVYARKLNQLHKQKRSEVLSLTCYDYYSEEALYQSLGKIFVRIIELDHGMSFRSSAF